MNKLFTSLAIHISVIANNITQTTLPSPQPHQLRIPTPKTVHYSSSSLLLKFLSIEDDSSLDGNLMSASAEEDSYESSDRTKRKIHQRIVVSRMKRKKYTQDINNTDVTPVTSIPKKRRSRLPKGKNDVDDTGTHKLMNPKETYWYKNYVLYPQTECKHFQKKSVTDFECHMIHLILYSDLFLDHLIFVDGTTQSVLITDVKDLH